MQKNYYTKIEKDLQQISDMLVLNGTLTECPGLVHGKMGIAIFFFHYAKFTKNELYADYAMDLIGEVLDQIHINSPANYEKGIAGIGVGINYLIQNNYLSVEDDICEDFDKRMVRAVMYDPWPNFSLYNGLTGYGRYWITRLHFQAPAILAQKCLSFIIAQIDEKLSDISTEHADVICFLYDLQKISGFESCIGLLEQCHKNWNSHSSISIKDFPRLGTSNVENIIHVYQRNRHFKDISQNKISITLKQIPDLDA